MFAMTYRIRGEVVLMAKVDFVNLMASVITVTEFISGSCCNILSLGTRVNIANVHQ